MTKEHVIAVVVLVIVLGAVGAGYQFYYKERLEEYAQNVAHLEALTKALDHLEKTFEGYEPRVLIKEVSGQVQPLADELVRRAAFFNMGGFLQIDDIPEGKMLKFYYEEQFRKMFTDLRQEVMARDLWFTYPNTTFGAATPESFAGRRVTKNDVINGLRQVSFGCSMIRMLLKANALAVDQIEFWPVQRAYGNLLALRTVGLAFRMRPKDLVKFVNELRVANRYLTIDALSIQNRYMLWRTEPPFEVRMLITQAQFVGVPKKPAPSGRPAAAPGRPDRASRMLSREGYAGRRTLRARPEPSRWTKIKRWLRNHYLWPF